MLGKLLKHEWKTVWKIPVLLFGILMIVAAAAGLTFALPIWDSDWIGLPMSGVMLLLLYYFAIIATGIGISIYFAVRYYKNMFTDEGYLTHTLPVTARQLLLNKVITMSVWNLISGIAVIASMMVFGGVAVMSLGAKHGGFAMDILDAVDEMKDFWHSSFSMGFTTFGITIVCLMLASAVQNAMMIIGSITLGQMVHKHKILGSIGAYFAISAVIQVVTTMGTLPLMFKMIMNENARYYNEWSSFSYFTSTYWVMIVVELLTATGLYFLSEYLISKKLELD